MPNVTISPTAMQELNRRTVGSITRSGQLSKDLERYYESLRRARARLRSVFSEKELSLIADAGNGTLYEPPATIQLLDGGLEDAIQLKGLDRKWEVDAATFLAKVRQLSFAERAAVVDLVERYWNWQPGPETENRPSILTFVD